jgi:pyruvate/2-oxoglutarate dehydrogenase complex dihydrolipoamide dehydrogenase (E3) component
VPHIFAIGDIVGQPMLAHKAVHEAHVAAEVAHGRCTDVSPAYKQGSNAGPKHHATGGKVNVEKRIPTAPSHPERVLRGRSTGARRAS